MRWKVLIVEDDINFRYAIRELVPWEEYDYEVAGEAVNGKQALEILKEKEVNVVLTDMEMPIMDGVALTAEIKRFYPDILVIALSAFDDFSFVKESMRLGAEDYILKQDFDAAKLIEILQNLQKKHLEEQRQQSDRHYFQKELLDYIQKKTDSMSNESNPYSKLRTRTNMMLCLVKSGQEIQGQEEGDYEGDLIFCMKEGNDTWIFLFQLPKFHRESEEAVYQLQILSRMKERLLGQAQIGAGDQTGNFAMLPSMYQMAKTALTYFMYFPNQQIIHYLDIRKFEEIRVRNYLYKPPEHLLDADSGELEQVLTEYGKNLERYMPNEHSVNMGFVHIYKEFQKGIQTENADVEIVDYYEKIREIHTVRDKFAYTRERAQKLTSHCQRIYKGTHPEIRRALEYIALHYADEISLHDVAEHVGLSENYCSNLFKQEMGENLTSYVNKIRIEHAKKLLHNKSLKVYEAAEAVGYKNATYLSTMFKKITGVSISEFREGKECK